MTPLNLQSWSQRARLALPRAGCAAGVLAHKLIVAGGTYWLDGKKFWDVRVDAFDARANHWVALAPLPQHSHHARPAMSRGCFTPQARRVFPRA